AVWPKVQPALNPLYEWSAKTRVNEIRDLVKRADAIGHPVPETGPEFAAFVDREDMQQNASEDPWGVPYYIVFNGASFQVGSAGKDRSRAPATTSCPSPTRSRTRRSAGAASDGERG